jgi:hypothetical protein
MYGNLRTARNAILTFTALVLLLTLPGLPWSSYCRYKFRKATTKAAIRLSKLRGYEPRLVSIAGECGLAGARVQAADSKSGWAGVSDHNGNFVLPGLLWYPGASYDLICSTDDKTARTARVFVPRADPTQRAIPVGRLGLSESTTPLAELHGLSAVARLLYDFDNRDYYRQLYDDLTFGLLKDEDKVDAVNRFVAAKLNFTGNQWELGSPRRVLEEGSMYCGHLSTALAAILAVGYETRMVDMSDAADPPHTHVVVEVLYGGEWHVFDPTFGVRFEKPDGEVAGYRDLRLDPTLVSPRQFAGFQERFPRVSLDWIQGVYKTGYHHMSRFCFQCSQYSHAWWHNPNGLGYVPSGSTIILAAAGVRPGTTITYHIRPQGAVEEVMTFTTRTAANSECVLNEEESPPLLLPSGRYDVFVDLEDGNASEDGQGIRAAITNWRLNKTLEVR